MRDAISDERAVCLAQMAERRIMRRPGRPLFAIWAVLSVLWTGGVGYNIYQRVCTQADMSRDVERDLDLISCTGQQCASVADSPTESKLDIVSTYIKFGSMDMAEATIGPPAILLLIVLGGIFMMRRREARPSSRDLSRIRDQDLEH
jgi:MYXO-CTERM domain-containing protein